MLPESRFRPGGARWRPRGEGRAFPDGFTWGTATAAHQIEGGNTNNDWWAFEHLEGSGCAEPSGDACDSWDRWEEDADLVAALGLDNYRFSVEWSRIEPAEGEFSRAALEHYRRQCLGLQERGIDPVVTFHHFTNPRWLADQGGWETEVAVERFGRFCTVVAEALGDVMVRACTVNEPNIVATMGWHAGMFPPGKRDVELSSTWATPGRRAPGRGRGHSHAAPGIPVGLTLSMTDYQAITGGEQRLESIRHHAEDVFLDATAGDDFLGVQVYTRMRIGPDGWAGYEDGSPCSTWATSSIRRPSATACSEPGTTRVVPAPARDRERHRDDRRRPAHRLRASALTGVLDAIDEEWTYGGTRIGRSSTTSNGPSAIGPASASSPSTARPSPARPSRVRPGWPQSHQATRSTPDGAAQS